MVAVDPGLVLFVTALTTALAGTIVAAVAYQGYRRNNSIPMFYLAIGIGLIAVGPLLISYGIAPIMDLPDAHSLLGVLWVTIAGLVSILYSLDYT